MTAPKPPSEPVVAIIIPIRELDDVGRPVVRRRPGRPRRVESAPTIDEALYNDAIAKAANDAIEQDSVVTAAKANDSLAVVDRAIRSVAEEAAALKFDREVATRQGRSDAAERTSSRRVGALARIGELLGIRDQLRRGKDDLDPDLVERAVALLVAQVEEVVTEVGDVPMADRFMAALRAQMAAAGHPASWGTSQRAR